MYEAVYDDYNDNENTVVQLWFLPNETSTVLAKTLS